MDLPPAGTRDRLWTPDKHMYPPLSREPVAQPVSLSAHHRLTRRPVVKCGSAVKASALAINVITAPVDVPVPTGFVGAKRSTGDTLPLLRLRTSKEELSANGGIMFHHAGDVTTGVASSAVLPGDVAVGVASSADLAGVITIVGVSSADLAGDVTVGVASSADFAGIVTIGVTPSADLAGVVTVSVVSSADLAGNVAVSVASSADLAGVVTVGVVSTADLAGVVNLGVASPAYPDSDFAASAPFMKECERRDALPCGAGLSPTDPDESGVELEAIVVGAVGTGDPWFLIGWAEGTDMEFSKHQVTPVFERMCVADPHYRRRLRSCRQ